MEFFSTYPFNSEVRQKRRIFVVKSIPRIIQRNFALDVTGLCRLTLDSLIEEITPSVYSVASHFKFAAQSDEPCFLGFADKFHRVVNTYKKLSSPYLPLSDSLDMLSATSQLLNFYKENQAVKQIKDKINKHAQDFSMITTCLTAYIPQSISQGAMSSDEITRSKNLFETYTRNLESLSHEGVNQNAIYHYKYINKNILLPMSRFLEENQRSLLSHHPSKRRFLPLQKS